MIYCWFADYHSLLPAVFSKIAGKRFYIVLGGYDVTYLEEFNYGSFNKKFRGSCARYSMRSATLNLPVARALGIMARSRAGDIRVKVIPTGDDPEIYLPSHDKEDVIVTVSLTKNWQRFMIKGIDRFIDLARKLPAMQFVIIGMSKEGEKCVSEKSENLLILPTISHEDLVAWYGKARFYAQFSRSEGLPNAVCEAMLRNCIPLGTNVGGIPEAMGDAGIVLDDWDADAMAEKIRTCANQDVLANRAREHIIQNYHTERREQELLNLMR